MSLHWSAHLIGIPYEECGRSLAGADCYGVAVLALERCGIRLELHGGLHPERKHSDRINALIEDAMGAGDWLPVESAAEFDLCLFNMGGMDRHFGVVVRPGWMLHADRGAGQSCTDRYDEGRWANRLAGVYRHRALWGRP